MLMISFYRLLCYVRKIYLLFWVKLDMCDLGVGQGCGADTGEGYALD
jgi:hypothetical protein